jgi:hypothetical protein
VLSKQLLIDRPVVQRTNADIAVCAPVHGCEHCRAKLGWQVVCTRHTNQLATTPHACDIANRVDASLVSKSIHGFDSKGGFAAVFAS